MRIISGGYICSQLAQISASPQARSFTSGNCVLWRYRTRHFWLYTQPLPTISIYWAL